MIFQLLSENQISIIGGGHSIKAFPKIKDAALKPNLIIEFIIL